MPNWLTKAIHAVTPSPQASVSWSDMEDDRLWSVYAGTSFPTRSGETVTAKSALALSPLYGGLRVLSEAVAVLPLRLYESGGDGSRQDAPEHPAAFVTSEFNPVYSLMDGLLVGQSGAALWGNTFAEIQRDSAGDPVALWPIHPTRVPEEEVEEHNGTVYYTVLNDDGERVQIASRDMLHVPGMLPDLDRGCGRVAWGRGLLRFQSEALGTGQATEQHVSSFFRHGASNRVAIKFPNSLGKDPELRAQMRREWSSVYGNPDAAHSAVFLEGGAEAQVLNVSPEQAQLDAARLFTAGQIARFLRIPPHKLGLSSSKTYANVEAEDRAFVQDTVQRWVTAWERELTRKLCGRGRHYFRFNINAILRATPEVQAKVLEIYSRIGLHSINEQRALLEMNPIEGGDRHFIETNNRTPLDRLDDEIDARMSVPEPANPVGEPVDDDAPNAMAETFARMEAERESAASKSAEAVAERERAEAERADAEAAKAEIEQERAELARNRTCAEIRDRNRDRKTLQRAMSGVTALESRMVAAAAKDHRTLSASLDRLYDEKLPSVFSDAVEPWSGELTGDGDALADHVAASRAELEALQDAKVSTLKETAERITAGWSGRAQKLTDRLLPALPEENDDAL